MGLAVNMLALARHEKHSAPKSNSATQRQLIEPIWYLRKGKDFWLMSQSSGVRSQEMKNIKALTVSPENRLSGEIIDKKWVIIDFIIGFGEISNTPHLPTSLSPPLFLNRSA